MDRGETGVEPQRADVLTAADERASVQTYKKTRKEREPKKKENIPRRLGDDASKVVADLGVRSSSTSSAAVSLREMVHAR